MAEWSLEFSFDGSVVETWHHQLLKSHPFRVSLILLQLHQLFLIFIGVKLIFLSISGRFRLTSIMEQFWMMPVLNVMFWISALWITVIIGIIGHLFLGLDLFDFGSIRRRLHPKRSSMIIGSGLIYLLFVIIQLVSYALFVSSLFIMASETEPCIDRCGDEDDRLYGTLSFFLFLIQFNGILMAIAATMLWRVLRCKASKRLMEQGLFNLVLVIGTSWIKCQFIWLGDEFFRTLILLFYLLKLTVVPMLGFVGVTMFRETVTCGCDSMALRAFLER